MNTKFWGPPGWKFLHTITFNYPDVIDEYNGFSINEIDAMYKNKQLDMLLMSIIQMLI